MKRLDNSDNTVVAATVSSCRLSSAMWRRWESIMYCITPIFRVELIFAIFANLDLARNFPPAKFSSREIFLHAKIKL